MSGEPAPLPTGELPAGEMSAGVMPDGVLVARVGAGANCSSAGSAIDILFYTSVIAGAVAVALAAAFPPRVEHALAEGADDAGPSSASATKGADPGDDPGGQTR